MKKNNFLIITHFTLLRKNNYFTKVVQKITTHLFVFSNVFFKSCWLSDGENGVECGRQHMKIYRIFMARCITKDTNTCSF
jgi:hypothetical protein